MSELHLCVAQPSASNPPPEHAAPEVCPARKTAECCPPSSRRSRRERAQRARRIAEVEARRKAVAYAEQVAAQGVSCPRAAAQLQIVPRTLRWWRQGQRKTPEVLANTITRPWGARGPSPELAWQLRSPILDEERRAFAAALDGHRQWAARELALDLAGDLNVTDRARLDRLAISSTLQELGYLTQRRIGHVERPKRLPRDELARRVADFREQTPFPESPVPEATIPASPRTDAQVVEAPMVETPVTEPRAAEAPVKERRLAEKSTPPQSPECTSVDSHDSGESLLAQSVSSDLLLAANTAADMPQVFAQASRSAHGGQRFTSWLRRSIAPLVSFFKTADIPQ